MEVCGHAYCSGELKCPFVAVGFRTGDARGRRGLQVTDCFPSLQYSQKEDKYEEEIKILTDKLKEVSGGEAQVGLPCVAEAVALTASLPSAGGDPC